jgi:hypothetical protein
MKLCIAQKKVLEDQVSMVVETNAQLQEEQRSQRDELSSLCRTQMLCFFGDEVIACLTFLKKSYCEENYCLYNIYM